MSGRRLVPPWAETRMITTRAGPQEETQDQPQDCAAAERRKGAGRSGEARLTEVCPYGRLQRRDRSGLLPRILPSATFSRASRAAERLRADGLGPLSVRLVAAA
jgi:hypothetical protein